MKMSLTVSDTDDNEKWSNEFNHDGEINIKKNIGLAISILHTMRFAGSQEDKFGISSAGKNKLVIEITD